MSFKVYVSFREEDQAIAAGKLLMTEYYMPFIPRLHRFIEGRTAEEWVSYYSSWIYSCDALWATPSAREHELAIARNFGIPIVHDLVELDEVKLPPYGELCRKFARFLATDLEITDPGEAWRRKDKADVLKKFENVVGRGPDALSQRKARAVRIAALALKSWDVNTGAKP